MRVTGNAGMSKQPHYENSLVCSCLLLEAEIEIGDVYMFKKLFGQLQRIGKALMLPVAILPAAGILLAFGNAMHNEQLVEIAPWLKRYHCNDFVGHGSSRTSCI